LGASRDFDSSASDKGVLSSGYNPESSDDYSLAFWYNGGDNASGDAEHGKAIFGSERGGTVTGSFGMKSGIPGLARYNSTWLRGPVATTDIADDTWHHVVLANTGSAETAKIYVDTVEEADADSTIDWPSNPSKMYFESLMVIQHPSNLYTDGKVAWVSAWDKTLSADEVKEIYRNPLAVPGNMILCFPLFGNDSPEVDFAGSRTITLTGTSEAFLGPPIHLF